MKAPPLLRHLPLAISLFALAEHTARVVLAGMDTKVAFLPDDAFYYLVLARNFAASGVWTFDHGLTRTTGFHLLYGYLTVPLAMLFPRSDVAYVNLCLIVGALLTAAAIVLTARLLSRRFGPASLWALPVVAGSHNFLMQTTSLMEWPWVLLITAVYYDLFARSAQDDKQSHRWALFAVGAAGSVARTDFGGVAAMLLVAGLALFRAHRSRAAVASGLAGLAGAVVGFVAVAVHNLILSGHAVQSSVRMIALKAQGGGFDPRPALYMLRDAAGLSAPLTAAQSVLGLTVRARYEWLGLLAAIGLALFALRQPLWHACREHARDGVNGSLLLAGILTPLSYVALYGAVGEARSWYSASSVVPLLVSVGAAFAALGAAFGRGARLTAAAAVVALAALNLASAQSGDPTTVTVKWAGDYLRTHPVGARVGAWNSGLVSFFEGGHIVNLDGVMNDEVQPYIRAGRLDCYLVDRRIEYVVDRPGMLLHPQARLGGYLARGLPRSLSVVRLFRLPDVPTSFWNAHALYRVDLARLATGRCHRGPDRPNAGGHHEKSQGGAEPAGKVRRG